MKCTLLKTGSTGFSGKKLARKNTEHRGKCLKQVLVHEIQLTNIVGCALRTVKMNYYFRQD